MEAVQGEWPGALHHGCGTGITASTLAVDAGNARSKEPNIIDGELPNVASTTMHRCEIGVAVQLSTSICVEPIIFLVRQDNGCKLCFAKWLARGGWGFQPPAAAGLHARGG